MSAHDVIHVASPGRGEPLSLTSVGDVLDDDHFEIMNEPPL